MVCEMSIMDATGDHKIIWDTEDAESVAAAKETFDRLRAKGYLAYTVKKGGDKGEIVREFDPTLEKLILSPPMAGG